MEKIFVLLAICAGNSPITGEFPAQRWHGALMFSLICAWINESVNNREAGDLRRHRAHGDVIIMMRNVFPIEETFHVCECLHLVVPEFWERMNKPNSIKLIEACWYINMTVNWDIGDSDNGLFNTVPLLELMPQFFEESIVCTKQLCRLI